MEVIILWRIKLDRFYCITKPAQATPLVEGLPIRVLESSWNQSTDDTSVKRVGDERIRVHDLFPNHA
jgi:hypothetical protein